MNISELKLTISKFDARNIGEEWLQESDIVSLPLDENGPISRWQLYLQVVDNDTYVYKIGLLNYKDLQNEIVGAYGSAQLMHVDIGLYEANQIDLVDDQDLEFRYLQKLSNGTVWLSAPGFNRDLYECEPDIDCRLFFRADITLVYLKPVKILEDLSGMLNCGMHSDLTLVVDQETFHVHKNILSARSVVFRRMFETDMKEKAEEKVKLKGIRAPVLREMLKFMYTGKLVSNTTDVMEDLYLAADMYDIPELKEVVAVRLEDGITDENAEKRLALAEQFGDSMLKNRCLDFINNAPSADWPHFKPAEQT